MPRISLFRPEKGQDYKFIDRQISEMFAVGGTDVHLHKYIGTGKGDDFKDVTQIQDLLFLENRDRKYDTDIYRVRGHYQVHLSCLSLVLTFRKLRNRGVLIMTSSFEIRLALS